MVKPKRAGESPALLFLCLPKHGGAPGEIHVAHFLYELGCRGIYFSLCVHHDTKPTRNKGDISDDG